MPTIFSRSNRANPHSYSEHHDEANSAQLSDKAKRRAVKEIVACHEKLKAISARAHVIGADTPDSSAYIQALTAAETKLAQLRASGLSTERPPFSMSRCTKGNAALAAGAATKAAQMGAASIAIVGCGAAVAVATPAALARGIYEGTLGVLFWDTELIAQTPHTAFEPITSTYKLVRGTGDPWEHDHNKVADIFRRISLLPKAREYAARPRLPTATIAATAAREISSELTQHYHGVAAIGQTSTPLVPPAAQRNFSTASAVPNSSSDATLQPEYFRNTGTMLLASNPAQGHHWRFQENENDAAAFNVFQGRLVDTAEYRNPLSHTGLVRRVDSLVEAMRASPLLRATCFAIASDSIEDCSDRVAVGLNDMEQALINHHAESGNLSVPGLFYTGIGLYKKHLLDEIAVAKIPDLRRRHRDVDEIEVRLAYPTELRDRLGLQGVTPAMCYRASAKVTERDINAAETAVNAKMQRGEGIPFLAKWQPWRQALRRDNEQPYKDLDERIEAARGAISIKPDYMNEQQWREALADQKLVEEVQQTDLASQLTHRFIADNGMRWM